MRKLGVLALLAVVLALAMSVSVAGAEQRVVFKAHLTPVNGVDTQPEGRATFKVGKAGPNLDITSLDCLVTVTGVVDGTSIHIHGQDGILVYLSPKKGGTQLIEGRFSGQPVHRTIEDGNFDRLEDGVSVADVIAAVEGGTAYVDVHTAQVSDGPTLKGWIE